MQKNINCYYHFDINVDNFKICTIAQKKPNISVQFDSCKKMKCLNENNRIINNEYANFDTKLTKEFPFKTKSTVSYNVLFVYLLYIYVGVNVSYIC